MVQTNKVKVIGGSWSIDANVGDVVKILVNDEEVYISDPMDCDVNIAFYLKRRNRPYGSTF